jgi:endonuclease YncB( thermonuclease family)
MMKYIALLLGCLFCLQASAEPVCKVIDGDTFKLCDGTSIRLSGIDAPEKGEPYYWDARKALAGLIQTHDLKLTNCHTDDTGKRQACDVFADGKDIQADIVKAGFAWDWPAYSHGRYSKIEAEAASNKLAIHSDPSIAERHWQSRQRYKRMTLKDDTQ